MTCFGLLFPVLLTAQFIPNEAKDQTDFYDLKTVRELRLSFAHENWSEKLDSLKLYGEGSLLGNASIDGVIYEEVGISYRDSKSFKVGQKRNGFNVKLDFINKEQHHQGYQTLKLSNALRDPSLVREVLSYHIAGQYMPAPKANYVKLFINDEYYGLFVNIEAVDDAFLQKHYGSSQNSFFKCTPNRAAWNETPEGCKNKVFASLEFEDYAQCYTYNYELKSKDGWDDLVGLTQTLSNSPKDIHKVLHVDETLWMLALNNVLVNLSSYSGQNSQNYFLYKSDDRRFRPIMWDLNLSFGSYKNTGKGSDLTLSGLQQLDPLLHQDNATKPLIAQLLKNPLYKKIYLSHIRTIVYDNFINGQYEKLALELQRLISNDVYKDPHKFYEHYQFLNSLEETTGKRSKIPGLVELMSKRTRYLKKHPDLRIYPPKIKAVKVISREKFDRADINTFLVTVKGGNSAKRVKLVYRFNTDDPYQEMYMNDDGKSNDGKANDKLFAATIDPKGESDTMEYYIRMENAKMVNFDPPNYMSQPHKVTLRDLNR